MPPPVFRGYKIGTLAWNGLKIKLLCYYVICSGNFEHAFAHWHRVFVIWLWDEFIGEIWQEVTVKVLLKIT